MTDDRRELEEALGHLSFTAQRQIPRPGTPEFPTAWDLAHKRIDDALTLWQLARDTQTPSAQAEHILPRATAT